MESRQVVGFELGFGDKFRAMDDAASLPRSTIRKHQDCCGRVVLFSREERRRINERWLPRAARRRGSGRRERSGGWSI
jgi:hypothetical protein